jgi:hypothetical protein
MASTLTRRGVGITTPVADRAILKTPSDRAAEMAADCDRAFPELLGEPVSPVGVLVEHNDPDTALD